MTMMILRQRRLYVVGMQSERERVRASFFCDRDPFCEVVRRPENTHGKLTGLLEWPAGICLQSKITDLILSFPCGNMNILFAHVFLFMAGYRNLHTFLPVICWSYLRTEISVILFAGNKLHFLFPLKPLCWCYLATALNLLSSSLPA